MEPRLLTGWVLDLPTLLFAAGMSALYLRGARLRALRGIPRPRRTLAFLSGLALVVVSHISPLAGWSEVLLWPHMIQHLVIILVAAPLIAIGAPVATIRVALPPQPRHGLAVLARRTRRLRRRLGAPPMVLVATGVHILSLWVWHTPVIYDAAVINPVLHLLEHATFLASAVWFWSEIRATVWRTPRLQALATLGLGLMIVQGGVLGAAITFASRPLYAVYDGYGPFTALEDQQLGGALMWVVPGFVYGSVAVRRFLRWLDHGDATARDTAVRI